MSFGRKCFLAYSPGEHKVPRYATVDCQFDETYFPYRPVGTRHDYGIHDSHDHDYVLHPDCDPTDEHLMDSIRNMPIQNASWNPTEILTDSFDCDFHDAMQQATAHLYNGDDAQPDTPSAGKYPHNSSLLTDDEEDDGIQDCVKDGDIILSNDWESNGEIQMDQATDKQLIEYISGQGHTHARAIKADSQE